VNNFNDPVWIATLRDQCRSKSQKQVGDEIGYSSAVVNQVLRGKYPGDVAKVEKAVRGAYMGETCYCPVMGEIPVNQCLEIQKRPFANTNPQRVQLYRACRAGCPNSQITERKKP